MILYIKMKIKELYDGALQGACAAFRTTYIWLH